MHIMQSEKLPEKQWQIFYANSKGEDSKIIADNNLNSIVDVYGLLKVSIKDCMINIDVKLKR